MTPLQIRSLLFLLPVVLSAWPMRTGLWTGDMVGAGPDVTTTLWTMWWYQQEWTDAAWGGISHYFNYPLGGRGAILSPLTATTWALLDPLLGPNRAGALTSWSQIALFGGAVAWLAREVGLSRAGALAALWPVSARDTSSSVPERRPLSESAHCLFPSDSLLLSDSKEALSSVAGFGYLVHGAPAP